jgi:hypothetical protein
VEDVEQIPRKGAFWSHVSRPFLDALSIQRKTMLSHHAGSLALHSATRAQENLTDAEVAYETNQCFPRAKEGGEVSAGCYVEYWQLFNPFVSGITSFVDSERYKHYLPDNSSWLLSIPKVGSLGSSGFSRKVRYTSPPTAGTRTREDSVTHHK